ncbi:ABC transporter ATP-binding protein [Roseovarius pelagicus]|uniref:ABC transporter ATP-binding protein n=1 Tax=Roseovarius pelagicus TaxID=2980108 RepID=A0ABY6D8H6_9RHOB|nr:ABC transporter ATP-binding protein [Roseovarius pelagicus]UXX81483.1 ABC transporter ATP-binding protein [Roseovarius pelagicus]
MLELRNVDAFYGRAQALFSISLKVEEGECVALLGRNGAGKTTTLLSIMNLVKNTGDILFKGKPLNGKQAFSVAKAGVGFVPDSRRIFPTLSVEENLKLGRKTAPDGAANWTVDRVYGVFPKLGQIAGRDGGNLSGGEQQMLSIARALMGNPDILMLDEPTEGLAPVIVEDLVEIISNLKREKMTVLLVEQNVGAALSLAERCYIYDHGYITEEKTSEEIAQDEKLKHELLGV